MIGLNWSHFFGCGEGYDALKKGLKRNMIGSQLFWIWQTLIKVHILGLGGSAPKNMK